MRYSAHLRGGGAVLLWRGVGREGAWYSNGLSSSQRRCMYTLGRGLREEVPMEFESALVLSMKILSCQFGAAAEELSCHVCPPTPCFRVRRDERHCGMAIDDITMSRRHSGW